MQLWLLDSEPIYTTQLSSRIHRELPGLDVRIAGSVSHLSQLIRDGAVPPVLLIVSQADFPDLEADMVQISGEEWQKTLDVWYLIDTDVDLINNRCIPRLAPVHQLISRIRDWAADATRSSGRSCHLHFILRPDGHSDHKVQYLLQSLSSRGLRIVYLPLMPTTQMRLVDSATEGLNLSEVLLRLAGDPDRPFPLSACWQLNQSGWLQFRPPERSDDLTGCDALTLRLLASRLRDTLTSQSEPTCAVIDCASMPFASALSAASLCDTCQIHHDDQANFASRCASFEADHFLRKLPDRCQTVQSDDDLLSALGPLLLRSGGVS